MEDEWDMNERVNEMINERHKWGEQMRRENEKENKASKR